MGALHLVFPLLVKFWTFLKGKWCPWCHPRGYPPWGTTPRGTPPVVPPPGGPPPGMPTPGVPPPGMPTPGSTPPGTLLPGNVAFPAVFGDENPGKTSFEVTTLQTAFLDNDKTEKPPKHGVYPVFPWGNFPDGDPPYGYPLPLFWVEM